MKDYGKLKLRERLEGNISKTVTTDIPTDGLIEVYNKVSNLEHERNENYILDDKLKSMAICYSVTYIDDNFPALASIAWNRPMYNGIVRLVTRYCVHPDLAIKNFGKGTDGMRLDTIDHIIQQIEFCKNKGYNDFFIGREDKVAGKRTKMIAEIISRYTNIDWQVSDKPKLVTPSPNNPAAWQYIIYNNRENFNYENILST